jgi:hypothetical protein
LENEEYFQVVKCIGCTDYTCKKCPLLTAIQEYCYIKICSALEAGPQIGNLFGFDMVCYSSCIEFAMEKCHPISALSEEGELMLKKSLLQMH